MNEEEKASLLAACKWADVDKEVIAARLRVRARFPLAYQDAHGNVWTDDLYNCDSHCIAAHDNSPLASWRARADAAWLLAAERV